MQCEILLLGKTKSTFLAEGIEEYFGRLQHYTKVTIKTIKIKKLQGSDATIKDKEGDLILAHITAGSLLVALDAKGKHYSSAEFSKIIDCWERRSVKHITFVIGGPLGLAEKVLERSELKLSLSKMTFTHDMARLLLLEQLYRAYTIKAGEKYHK